MKKETDLTKQLKAFREIMRAGGDRERAVFEKAYLKSPYKFFGTSLPFADRTAKEFRKQNKKTDREYIIALAEELFNSGYHDEKRLGLRILQFYPDYLDLSVMPLLEHMLAHSPTWDLIDDISIHLVGTVLERDRRAYRYLKQWGRSESFWMRRSSLISQILLFRKNKGDNKLFYLFAECMLDEKEFFIRKAIGWCIREISKVNPGEACSFLMKVRDKASGLTLREGAKRLPEDMKTQVLGRI